MAKQIIVTQNDYGIELETQFVNDKKKPLDITGYDVKVKIIYDDKTIDTISAGHKDSVNGIAYIVLEKEHLINAGLHTSVWSVVDEDEHVTAQENVYYFVKDVEGSEDNTPTTDLPINIDDVLDKFNDIDNNLFELTEQINVVNKEIDNKFNEQQTKIDNTLKKIDKFSEIHYINSIADEMSILIKCMNGETVLIDCGETFSANKIKNRLDALNVTEINHFIITHFHSDHAGSYDMILTNFNVDNVYYKPITWAMSQKEIGWNTPTIYNGFVAKVEQLGIQSYSLTEDKTITINEYEKIKLMNTSPYPYTNKSSTTNYDVYDYNYESLMCYYTNGTTKVLFQADCPSNVAYSNYGDTIKNVDHLQVTHHGGEDVLKKEWTQNIRAKTAFYANTKFNTVEHYKAYTMTKLYTYDFNVSNSGCILVTSGSLTPTVTMVEKTLGDRFIDMGDDLWVYVDSSGNLVENGFVENNGKKYIMKDWYLALPSPDGWYYGIENQAYALNSGGSVKCNQWVKTNGYNYYVDDRGVFIKNGIYKVGTTDVTFDEEGHANN